MPTAIRVTTAIAKSDVSKRSDHNQLVSIALFSGIGLLITLALLLLGFQGVWF